MNNPLACDATLLTAKTVHFHYSYTHVWHFFTERVGLFAIAGVQFRLWCPLLCPEDVRSPRACPLGSFAYSPRR